MDNTEELKPCNGVFLDLNKPVMAKIYDYDRAYYDAGCNEKGQSLNYVVWEVETIYLKSLYEPLQIMCRNGLRSKSFEILEQME